MMNPYAVPSLVAAILSAWLGGYVLHRDPKATLNRTFALLGLAVAVWCFGEFMHRITSGATSLMWYRVSGFGWCFVGGIILHFALVFARREKILRNKLVYLVLYGPSIIFLYLAWSTSLIFQLKITEMPWGNTALPGDLAWTFTIYIFTYVILGAYLCFRVYRGSPVSLEGKQVLALMVALLTPLVIGGTTDLVLPMMGIVVMGLAALSSAVAVGIIAYAILRYKLFVLPPVAKFFIPVPEAHLTTKPKYKLEEGRGYLIKEREPDLSAKLFMDQTTHGIPGLWITSQHPKKAERHGLRRTPVLSLNAKRFRGEVTLSPNKLDRAKALVENQLARSRGRSVVMVDCFKELVVENGFKRTLEFIQGLGEICSENASNLIVRVDPLEFTKQQLTDVERALEKR